MVNVGVPFVSCASTDVSAAFGGDWLATSPTVTPGVRGPAMTQAL